MRCCRCAVNLQKLKIHTVEPRFNEPLSNEVLGITNQFPQSFGTSLNRGSTVGGYGQGSGL